MGIRFRHSIALVRDIEVSKQFYKDILGLSIVQDFDIFVLFQNDFAIHRADLFYDYINKPYHGEKMGHDNVDFYLTTTDLEHVSDKLKENKIVFIHDIKQMDWGEKVIRIYDPDGHILEIGDAD
jgi:catechol 2,3-dioxygenase-like lactoylglutathione lyase family enzyme